jgi:hypothetical protein
LLYLQVGEHSSAALCGAGSWKWAAWISMAGYLAELSNPLLNMRWWLMQTLEEHSISFPVVNILVVLSFIGRILLFPYIIVYNVLPRYDDFKEHQQLLAFALCVMGNLVICLMSLHWLKLLFGKGIGGLLQFKLRRRTAGATFTFAEDMDREGATAPEEPVGGSCAVKKLKRVSGKAAGKEEAGAKHE